MATEKRLIDANDFIAKYCASCGGGCDLEYERCATVIDLMKAPTVEAVEVVHGRWLLEREPDGKPYCLHCSVCDGDFSNPGIMQGYDYCPNCGAKMDGECNV